MIQGDSMSDKKNNIHLIRTGGRKVTKTTTEYDWNSLERKAVAEKQREIPRRQTEFAKRVRYQKKQKQKRLKIQRRRALIVFVLAFLLVIVLMFMTPIFSIRSVSVEGNRIVTAEQFQEKLKPLVGQNLFRTGGGKIEKVLKTISYIDTVEVQKRIFPPSVKINVTEYVPVGTVKIEGKNLLVNSELRVLTDDGVAVAPVPVVSGFPVSEYAIGEILKSEETEKHEIVSIMLRTLEATEIIDKVVEIDVNDIAGITMNYDNRINAMCGSQLDMEHKLRLFKETVSSNSLAENARGNMDLSKPGTAIITP